MTVKELVPLLLHAVVKESDGELTLDDASPYTVTVEVVGVGYGKPGEVTVKIAVPGMKIRE